MTLTTSQLAAFSFVVRITRLNRRLRPPYITFNPLHGPAPNQSDDLERRPFESFYLELFDIKYYERASERASKQLWNKLNLSTKKDSLSETYTSQPATHTHTLVNFGVFVPFLFSFVPPISSAVWKERRKELDSHLLLHFTTEAGRLFFFSLIDTTHPLSSHPLAGHIFSLHANFLYLHPPVVSLRIWKGDWFIARSGQACRQARHGTAKHVTSSESDLYLAGSICS